MGGPNVQRDIQKRKASVTRYTYDVHEAWTTPFTLSVSTMIRFLLSCSCTRMTFSVPFTTKYPPGSRGHSIILASCSSVLPARTHLLLLSITGKRPIFTFRWTIFLPRVY